MTGPSRLYPARQPWEPAEDQDRARQRFQAAHPEVGFIRRTAGPVPDWLAYWVAGDGVDGRSSTDFGTLLDEVFDVFGWEDRGDEQDAAGAGGR